METNSLPKTEKKQHKLRWLYPTPGRLLVVLLVVEGILLLSERFHWFAFNEHKGWTVLIAVGVIGVFLLLMHFWFIVSLVFHWRFQFSIRFLLLLTVAVAVPFSWFAVEMKWAKEQREGVDALMKSGGIVGNDAKFYASANSPALVCIREQLGDDFLGNVDSVSLTNTTVTDAGLERLKGWTKLQLLFLGNTKVTDAGLEYLKGLTQLQLLHLYSTEVTDAGLEHLKGLKKLRELFLGNTKVTDAGLEHLKGLTKLNRLFLGNTKVTDAGLEYLKGLTQLQQLDLDSTEVTDAGLEHLKGLTQFDLLFLGNTEVTDAGLEYLEGLTQLRNLDLSNTKVTDAGVAKLQKALPNCKIYH